jgi:hypothetical protein
MWFCMAGIWHRNLLMKEALPLGRLMTWSAAGCTAFTVTFTAADACRRQAQVPRLTRSPSYQPPLIRRRLIAECRPATLRTCQEPCCSHPCPHPPHCPRFSNHAGTETPSLACPNLKPILASDGLKRGDFSYPSGSWRYRSCHGHHDSIPNREIDPITKSVICGSNPWMLVAVAGSELEEWERVGRPAPRTTRPKGRGDNYALPEEGEPCSGARVSCTASWSGC